MAGSAVTRTISAFLEGGTFISARRARMALMVSITASMASVSAGKSSAASYSGHREVIRYWLVSPAVLGRACQISSVMKGMKGCSSFSSVTRT